MGYIGILLLIVIYSYAVIGVRLFAEVDPIHFGTLHESMLTMFQVVTLEGWPELLSAQIGAETGRGIVAVAYFVSFILVGTMIMLNLFIGLIVNSMHEAQAEMEAARLARLRNRAGLANASLEEELAELEAAMSRVQQRVHLLRRQVLQATDDEAQGNGTEAAPMSEQIPVDHPV